MNNTGYMVISSESGSTYNDADNHYFRTADSSEYMAKFLQNGAVELYHNKSKKFQTTSGGATVTGALVASGDVFGAGIYSDGGEVQIQNSIVFYNRRINFFRM